MKFFIFNILIFFFIVGAFKTYKRLKKNKLSINGHIEFMLLFLSSLLFLLIAIVSISN